MFLGGSWRAGLVVLLFVLGCAPPFRPQGPATAGATKGTLRVDRASLPPSHSLSLKVQSGSHFQSGDDAPRELPPGEYSVWYSASTAKGESSADLGTEKVVIEAGRTTTLPIRRLSKKVDPGMLGAGAGFGAIGAVSLALGIVLLTGGDAEPSEDGAIEDAIGLVGAIVGGAAVLGGVTLTVIGSIPRLRWGDLPERSPSVRSGLSLRLTF